MNPLPTTTTDHYTSTTPCVYHHLVIRTKLFTRPALSLHPVRNRVSQSSMRSSESGPTYEGTNMQRTASEPEGVDKGRRERAQQRENKANQSHNSDRRYYSQLASVSQCGTCTHTHLHKNTHTPALKHANKQYILWKFLMLFYQESFLLTKQVPRNSCC